MVWKRCEIKMKREWIKTFSYGTMHFLVAITVAYVLTGDWRVALSVGSIEPIVQTLAYTFHEKAWATNRLPQIKLGSIPFGKDYGLAS